MKKIIVAVVTQVRLYQFKDKLYSDPSFAKIIERYSKTFDKMNLVTRIIRTNTIPSGYIDISNYCLNCCNVGSISKYLTKKPSSKLDDLIKDSDLIVLRVPSLVSIKTYSLVKKHNKKYMTEVMGCAWDAYWNHGISGKFIAPVAYMKVKDIIKNADYSLYVTQQFLQNRYPCNGETVGISNVDIKNVDKPKEYNNFNRKSFTMMTAGAVNVKYKGQEYVIKAMKDLKEKDGITIKYYLAGKGDNIRLKKIAKKNGVADNVIFLGMLSKDELEERMRNTDIYIQPSLQEGLPRSLIEAMSHGCVCLGANTAGIPELIEEKEIFKRKSPKAIRDKILYILDANLSGISKANTLKSKKYNYKLLDAKRQKFMSKVANGINNESKQ